MEISIQKKYGNFNSTKNMYVNLNSILWKISKFTEMIFTAFVKIEKTEFHCYVNYFKHFPRIQWKTLIQ